MSGNQFLHPILPCEFLDSPEFESSRATVDEKFKVCLYYRYKKNCPIEYNFKILFTII